MHDSDKQQVPDSDTFEDEEEVEEVEEEEEERRENLLFRKNILYAAISEHLEGSVTAPETQ